jgi:YVTN family beta-propeller protein
VDVEAGDVEAAIETGQEVSHMVALTPDGRRAFVASIGSGTVTAIDVAARKALGHVATGKGAEGIDVTPDGREVWVTNREADSVSVLDAARFSVLATLESKSFPIRVRITPDGRRALVSNARSGDVAVFDVAARKLVRRVATKIEAVPAESRLLSFPGSSVPIGIVVTPDGARAFVAHANADAIAVLDLRTWEASGRLRAGREPDGMAFSPVRVGQP